jgi:hypothetical protein
MVASLLNFSGPSRLFQTVPRGLTVLVCLNFFLLSPLSIHALRFALLSHLLFWSPLFTPAFPGAGKRSPGKREGWHYRYLPKPLAKHIHWALLGAFFLALLIGVTIAGVFFLNIQAKTKDRNDPNSGDGTCPSLSPF